MSEIAAGVVLVLIVPFVVSVMVYLFYVSTCPPGKSWPQRRRQR